MGFYETLILAARVAQFIFSIIVLGTAGYVASTWSAGYYYNYVPSQVGFIIFVSVWSLIVVGYQILVPRFSEKLSHKFIILGLDALTAMFWFAGFIALAVLAGYYAPFNQGNRTVQTLQAAAAFGAFAWISFMITTVMSALNVFRGNTGGAKHHHNPEIGHSVA